MAKTYEEHAEQHAERPIFGCPWCIARRGRLTRETSTAQRHQADLERIGKVVDQLERCTGRLRPSKAAGRVYDLVSELLDVLQQISTGG